MIMNVMPRLLVHYAPGVLAVLRRDLCRNHTTEHGFAHCERGTVFTVVSISGLEPDEVSWVLSRCWIPRTRANRERAGFAEGVQV